MTERINMFEHPEYQNVPQWLKESPLFDFDIYLKNKGKTLEEFEQMLAKDISDFDTWLESVSTRNKI